MLRLAAVPLCCLLASPALAADVGALRTALAATPQSLLDNPEFIQWTFVDRAAWSAATEGEDEVAALQRMSFATMIGGLDTLGAAPRATWEKNAGVALSDIAWFAGAGAPPNTIGIWGFDDEQPMMDLVSTLEARDFKRLDDGVTLGNGEALMVDFDKRDPQNPWRGGVGQARFIQPHDLVLFQAATPEDVEALATSTTSAAEDPRAATLLSGLEEGLGKDTAIVEAMLISPLLANPALDPASFLGAEAGSPKDLEKKLAETSGATAEGVPLFISGILADTQTGDRQGLAIALVYPDCASADRAVETITQRWSAALPDLTGKATGTTVAGFNESCAAVIDYTADAEAPAPATRALQQIVMRDFTLLDAGGPPAAD